MGFLFLGTLWTRKRVLVFYSVSAFLLLSWGQMMTNVVLHTCRSGVIIGPRCAPVAQTINGHDSCAGLRRQQWVSFKHVKNSRALRSDHKLYSAGSRVTFHQAKVVDWCLNVSLNVWQQQVGADLELLTLISVRLDVSCWFYSAFEGFRCLLIPFSCQPRVFSISPSCFMFPVLSLIFTLSTPLLSLSYSQGSLWSFTSKDVFVPLFCLQRCGLRQTGAWNCPASLIHWTVTLIKTTEISARPRQAMSPGASAYLRSDRVHIPIKHCLISEEGSLVGSWQIGWLYLSG